MINPSFKHVFAADFLYLDVSVARSYVTE